MSVSLLSYVDMDALAQLKDATVRRLDEVKASYALGRTRCRQLQLAVEALGERRDQADARALLQEPSPCEEYLGAQGAACDAMAATVAALHALVARLQYASTLTPRGACASAAHSRPNRLIKETAPALSAAEVAGEGAGLVRGGAGAGNTEGGGKGGGQHLRPS
jgi:hypothetical protein